MRVFVFFEFSILIAFSEDTPMNKVTPFLMFNDQLEAAIEFYTETFPNSEIRTVARTGAYSGPMQPPIPFQRSHLFRLNAATHSI